MDQNNLFADTPRARNTDPESSHVAAAKIKSSGALSRQQQIALEMVTRFPGHTSAELADIYAKEHGQYFSEWRIRFARRLPELAGVQVRKGGSRMCRKQRSLAITWWPK
jgi:hypothetical protein